MKSNLFEFKIKVPYFFTVNNHEIRFLGLARSGNHAVIGWIISQFDGSYKFWNNVPVFNKKIFFSKTNYLIYSHEDRFLNDMFSKDFFQNHDMYVGKSKRTTNIILLRDPFNFFATRLKRSISCSWYGQDREVFGHPKYEYNVKEKKDLIKIWKEYAKEFIGETSLIPNKVTISFNEWFKSRRYRKKISNELGLRYNEETLRIIDGKICGAGSTWDSDKFDKNAQKMRVLERWKDFVGNELYKGFFNDPELVRLSEHIFGCISGTEVLYR